MSSIQVATHPYVPVPPCMLGYSHSSLHAAPYIDVSFGRASPLLLCSSLPCPTSCPRFSLWPSPPCQVLSKISQGREALAKKGDDLEEMVSHAELAENAIMLNSFRENVRYVKASTASLTQGSTITLGVVLYTRAKERSAYQRFPFGRRKTARVVCVRARSLRRISPWAACERIIGWGRNSFVTVPPLYPVPRTPYPRHGGFVYIPWPTRWESSHSPRIVPSSRR